MCTQTWAKSVNLHDACERCVRVCVHDDTHALL